MSKARAVNQVETPVMPLTVAEHEARYGTQLCEETMRSIEERGADSIRRNTSTTPDWSHPPQQQEEVMDWKAFYAMANNLIVRNGGERVPSEYGEDWEAQSSGKAAEPETAQNQGHSLMGPSRKRRRKDEDTPEMEMTSSVYARRSPTMEGEEMARSVGIQSRLDGEVMAVADSHSLSGPKMYSHGSTGTGAASMGTSWNANGANITSPFPIKPALAVNRSELVIPDDHWYADPGASGYLPDMLVKEDKLFRRVASVDLRDKLMVAVLALNRGPHARELGLAPLNMAVEPRELDTGDALTWGTMWHVIRRDVTTEWTLQRFQAALLLKGMKVSLPQGTTITPPELMAELLEFKAVRHEFHNGEIKRSAVLPEWTDPSRSRLRFLFGSEVSTVLARPEAPSLAHIQHVLVFVVVGGKNYAEGKTDFIHLFLADSTAAFGELTAVSVVRHLRRAIELLFRNQRGKDTKDFVIFRQLYVPKQRIPSGCGLIAVGDGIRIAGASEALVRASQLSCDQEWVNETVVNEVWAAANASWGLEPKQMLKQTATSRRPRNDTWDVQSWTLLWRGFLLIQRDGNLNRVVAQDSVHQLLEHLEDLLSD